MPEWLKGTGCKPVGYAYVGSNPTPSTITRCSVMVFQALQAAAYTPAYTWHPDCRPFSPFKKWSGPCARASAPGPLFPVIKRAGPPVIPVKNRLVRPKSAPANWRASCAYRGEGSFHARPMPPFSPFKKRSVAAPRARTGHAGRLECPANRLMTGGTPLSDFAAERKPVSASA